LCGWALLWQTVDAGLPDFSWCNIPKQAKCHKIDQITVNFTIYFTLIVIKNTKAHKIYQIVQ
jgi:hypothetical protein